MEKLNESPLPNELSPHTIRTKDTFFNLNLTITDDKKAMILLSGPEEYISGSGIKDLPEHIRDFVMAFATITKQLEIIGNKLKIETSVTINGRPLEKELTKPIEINIPN